MSALITSNQVPGYFNYLRPEDFPDKFQLVQVEELEEVAFASFMKETVPDNFCVSCRQKLKNDLPLASDFGEINSPYELIYARLEGLQYSSRV